LVLHGDADVLSSVVSFPNYLAEQSRTTRLVRCFLAQRVRDEKRKVEITVY
jgi:phage head maturation protease